MCQKWVVLDPPVLADMSGAADVTHLNFSRAFNSAL